MIGYSHSIWATVAPVCVSCKSSHHCSSKGGKAGYTVNDMFLQAEFKECFNTMMSC